MGGNVFNSAVPIKKEFITPTLFEFFREFLEIFPKTKPYVENIKALGSTYKKEISGDIDLGLSEKALEKLEDWELDKDRIQKFYELYKKRAKTATEEQLQKRAILTAIAEKIQKSNTDIIVDSKGTTAGTLFILYPQYSGKGKNTGKTVQIDINVGDLDWLEFAYYSKNYTKNIKGLHRTQLLLALFGNRELTFSHNYGVKSKKTQKIQAKTPQQAVTLLNKLYDLELTFEDAKDFTKILEIVQTKLDKKDRYNVLDIYMRILDSTRADIPEDLQQYWLDNQKRLELKGKYLPSDSKLLQKKIEIV